jgi:hypothetical protein
LCPLDVFRALVALNSLLVLGMRPIVSLTLRSDWSTLISISVSAVKIISRSVQTILRIRTALTTMRNRILHATTSVMSTLRDILVKLVSVKRLSVDIMGLELVVLYLVSEFKTLILFGLQGYLEIIVNLRSTINLSL